MNKISRYFFITCLCLSYSLIRPDSPSRAQSIAQYIKAVKCANSIDAKECEDCPTILQVLNSVPALSDQDRVLFLDEALQKSIHTKEPQLVVAQIARQRELRLVECVKSAKNKGISYEKNKGISYEQMAWACA